MTNRAGRRRRHKRHKAMMLVHPVRVWPAWRLGQEFARMRDFMASSVPRGCYIDHDGQPAMLQGDFLQVARMPSLPASYASWKKMPTMPPIVSTITTYRLKRRRESMLFYGGRNRRERELPATLEEV